MGCHVSRPPQIPSIPDIDLELATTGHIGVQICSRRPCGRQCLQSCLSASLRVRPSQSSFSDSSSALWSSRSPARWELLITSRSRSSSGPSLACMARTQPSAFEPSSLLCGPLFSAFKLATSLETASPQFGPALPTFPTTYPQMLVSPQPVC
jgi:hypothetical protein